MRKRIVVKILSRKGVVVGGLGVFLFLSLLVVWAIASRKTSTPTSIIQPSSEGQEHFTVPDVSPNQSTLGVVLFGYGGAGHDGGYLTDAIQIIYTDFDRAKIFLISIPRDLWVKLPSGREVKINEVVTASADKNNLVASGAQGLKTVLTEITGLPLSYFVGIDFVGFQRAIGLHLKGIDVEVGETLDDPWYPIKGEELNLCGMSPEEIAAVHANYSGFELERQFACRYKRVRFEKGTVHMLGEEALAYVRSRHGSAEGDISRGKRQQEVLAAIKKKLFTLEALDKLPGFFTEIAKNTTTDIDLKVINYFLPVLKKSREFTVTTINLSTTNVLATSKTASGVFILIPKAGMNNWNDLRTYISEQINSGP